MVETWLNHKGLFTTSFEHLITKYNNITNCKSILNEIKWKELEIIRLSSVVEKRS